jgi:two-component system, NtrC family, response regulator HydG
MLVPNAMVSKPSILVVDDEPDICANLQDILSEFGYEVDTATSGQSALELVDRKAYDIALLDLKMPGMSGVELYKEIKRRSSGTVAVIISAYASTSSAKEALEAGAWRLLSKPVDVSQVMQCIDEAMNQPLVLLVDDDQELCASLWDILRSQGIRVKLAHNVADASAALENQEYQVAIVDLKLPGGDGLEVCAEVKEKNPQAKTVLITGFRAELDRQAGHLPVVDATCFKPFDVAELLATIRRLIKP